MTSLVKRFKNGILLFLIGSFALGCSSIEEDNKDPNEKEANCINSTDEGYRTIGESEEEREYILYVPESYDSNNPTPLIINFHGFGGCASDFYSEVGEGFSKLNNVADDNNFIIAYPQGVERLKGAGEWDPGDSGIKSLKDNDTYFVEQIISEISVEFNIDPIRIYASGYSNGGMMTYGLACTLSEKIAAVGIMSGIMLEGSCDEDFYTSIIHFHGKSDDVLPIEGNQDYQSVTEGVNFWLEHNNIPSSSIESIVLNNGDVIKEEYKGGNGETSVVLYTINHENGKSGGHVWFTENIGAKSPNQILWDFLSKHTLDD